MKPQKWFSLKGIALLILALGFVKVVQPEPPAEILIDNNSVDRPDGYKANVKAEIILESSGGEVQNLNSW